MYLCSSIFNLQVQLYLLLCKDFRSNCSLTGTVIKQNASNIYYPIVKLKKGGEWRDFEFIVFEFFSKIFVDVFNLEAYINGLDLIDFKFLYLASAMFRIVLNSDLTTT